MIRWHRWDGSRIPLALPILAYWPTKDAVEAIVVTDAAGAWHFWIDGDRREEDPEWWAALNLPEGT